MEVRFSPEQEAKLNQFAIREGKNVEQVVLDAVTSMLEERARFEQDVRKGLDSLDRGEFIEHEDVEARIEQLLRSG